MSELGHFPFAPAKRRSAGANLVDILPPAEDSLPVRVVAQSAGISLTAWLRDHRALVSQHLRVAGGILFRRFAVASAEDFRAVVAASGSGLLDYVYGSTPRTRMLDQIYTSTEYPADQTIPQHNEMAYATSWPAKLWFCCLVPARAGGQTPLADSRRVLERIDPEVRLRFARHGVMYVRNYGTGVDLRWQQSFETEDPHVVERFCAEHGIHVEWRPGGALRTTQICQAMVAHPETGERVWFNQAHLFHPSSLSLDVRRSLASHAPQDLPRNALYGDGAAIEDDVLDGIRAAYEAESRGSEWLPGDVLLIDNVLLSHGRRPYTGERRVLVAMSA